MADVDLDARLRHAAMGWLDVREHQGLELVTSDELARFHFEGQRVPLIDRQRGIRKPAILDAALTFRTTFRPPGQRLPYDDAEGPDGLLRYKYRGENPTHPENVAMRNAFEQRLPLVWFFGVAPGVYVPRYPVWLAADEPEQLQFCRRSRWCPIARSPRSGRGCGGTSVYRAADKATPAPADLPRSRAAGVRTPMCHVPTAARDLARRGAHHSRWPATR